MVLYFTFIFYGLAFFVLGVVITAKDMKISNLALARILWILALFGYLHGIFEWGLLYTFLFNARLETPWFIPLSDLILVTSFGALLSFGVWLCIISYEKIRSRKLPLSIKVGATLGILLLVVLVYLGPQRGHYARLLIAFPGGIISGAGLIIYSKTVRRMSIQGSHYLIYAGIFMIIYAFLAGVISPHMMKKVIILRGLSAVGITYFIYRGLLIFDTERLMILKEQISRIAQTEKLTSIGRLAAGVAHEMNNPLTNVLLNAELLHDQMEGNEKAQQRAKLIQSNAERASKIAKELLGFAREKHSDMEIVDLNEIVRSSLALTAKAAGRVRMILADRQLPVNAVFWRMEEVIINLLLNAFDACEAGEEIRIETGVAGGSAFVSVTDNGCGIEEEHLGKLFDPFFTTKEPGKGTGLGLSICYTIVEQHGGNISVQSVRGEKTVITVTLPLVKEYE